MQGVYLCTESFENRLSARPSLTHRVNGGSLPTRSVSEGLERFEFSDTPTHSRGRGTRLGHCGLFSLKKG
jgi:hypothetical protein